MSGGSGEQAVLMAACGQMGRHYDLPTGIAAGMADSKLPDAQSGYEKAYTNTLAGHCGANLVYESAGMQASLLGTSFEGYVIDNDMLGAINRTVRGIEVDADSLSVDVMREVCIDGPVHYLGHEQTLKLMKRDYVYPEVGDRLSPKDWAEQGSTDIFAAGEGEVRRNFGESFSETLPGSSGCRNPRATRHPPATGKYAEPIISTVCTRQLAPPVTPWAGTMTPASPGPAMRWRKQVLAREEIFGPVMSVLGFKDAEEAVSIANDLIYGLVGAVWSNNISTAHKVAAAVRVGTMGINNYFGGDVTVPLGGFKQSGNGRDKSMHAFDD